MGKNYFGKRKGGLKSNKNEYMINPPFEEVKGGWSEGMAIMNTGSLPSPLHKTSRTQHSH